MGLMNRIADWIVSRSTTYSDHPAQWLIDWVRGGEPTLSGVSVTVEAAIKHSAVWACVRVRSEDVAKLPCFLYRRLPDGGKTRAIDDHRFSLIRERPNPRMTAFEFKQLMQTQVDLRGNAYALKEFDGRGRVVALWPVCPTKVTVLASADGYDLFYKINLPGEDFRNPLPAEAVLHLRGPSLDGMCGLSPVGYHRETIGLGIAAQRYGAAFFGNSAMPKGALTVPHVLDKAAATALRASWEERHKGLENAKQIAIFDGGMKWEQVGMDHTDAQYLETRNFQNREIWRMYRMPPHKVGDLEKATFSNIEQQALEYVTDCLLTELVRWEQALSACLLNDDERGELFFEFLPDALLRGDLKSRYEAYAVARNWGWMNVDEIRERENMNPLPDGKGKVYLQPLNMVEAGTKPPPASQQEISNPKALLAFAQQLVAFEEARALPPALHTNGHGAHQ